MKGLLSFCFQKNASVCTTRPDSTPSGRWADRQALASDKLMEGQVQAQMSIDGGNKTSILTNQERGGPSTLPSASRRQRWTRTEPSGNGGAQHPSELGALQAALEPGCTSERPLCRPWHCTHSSPVSPCTHGVWDMWSTTRTPALPLFPNVITCARGHCQQSQRTPGSDGFVRHVTYSDKGLKLGEAQAVGGPAAPRLRLPPTCNTRYGTLPPKCVLHAQGM